MVFLKYFTSFLILINPFALFIYLIPLMDEIDLKDFLSIIARATLISLVMFVIFGFSGYFIFESIFQIRYESFLIFGGLVVLSMALIFILQGKKSFITLKGKIDDIASEIAFPFMVGAGSISMAIIIRNNLNPVLSFSLYFCVLAAVFLLIMGLALLRYHFSRRTARAGFDRYLGIFLRINGFFVGSIGVDMVVRGIKDLIAL